VRDLTLEVSRLQERLQAAPNNNHSLDTRIADLEAQLVSDQEPHPVARNT
jgi:hypothetical protein